MKELTMKSGNILVIFLLNFCGLTAQTVNFPIGGGGAAAPASSIQYNNSTAFGGVSRMKGGTDLIFTGQGFAPVTSGNISVYARAAGSASLLGVSTPQDSFALLVKGQGNWRQNEAAPLPGSITPGGTLSLTASITPTVPTITNASYRDGRRRLVYAPTATAGTHASIRSVDIAARNNSANSGGFLATFCGNYPNGSANGTGFMGVLVATGATNMPTMAGLTNCIGIGFDKDDTNYSIVHNDGSGNATKIDLGSNFPLNIANTPWLELVVYCAPNTSYVAYMVTNKGNNKTVTGSVSGDIPATSAFMKMYMGSSVTLTGTTVNFEWGGFKYASFY